MAAALRPPPPLFATRQSARPARGEFVLYAAVILRRAGRNPVGRASRLRIRRGPRNTAEPTLFCDTRLAARIVGARGRKAVGRASIVRSDDRLVFDGPSPRRRHDTQHHELLYHFQGLRRRFCAT